MTTKKLTAVLLVAVAATAAFARARRGPVDDGSVRTFQVTGVVVAPLADGRVTVAHDEIAGYMPAMTMAFPVGPGASGSVNAGDRVRFRLSVTAEQSQADRFEVTAHGAALTRAVPSGGATSVRRLKMGDALPPFSLVTHRDRPFTAADLRGRTTAVTFVFSRCPVPEFCPATVKRFKDLRRRLESDRSLDNVRLASVTLDPAFDTPAVLAEYARGVGADSDRWEFVTGAPEAIADFAAAFSIHVERNGPFLDHTLATAVIGPDGRIVEIWRGNSWKVDELVDVLRRAAKTGA
jgi:protein SCO1/2